MNIFTQSFKKSVLSGMIASMLLAGATSSLFGQAAPSAEEGALIESIKKTTDPAQQLQLLQQWKEKFPDSQYKVARGETIIGAYQAKSDGNGMYQASKELLAIDPKNFTAHYLLTLLTPSLDKKDPAGQETGTKAANGLLGLLDDRFAAAKKPAAVSDADWAKQRTGLEVQCYRTLGWVEWQKKAFVEAEGFFVKGLEKDSGNAELSNFLGTVIILQKNAARQPQALWHFARAGHIEGPSALAPAAKSQVAAYFKRVYGGFACEPPMDQFIAMATANVMPPADLKIKSKSECLAENEEKFKSENPQLYLFIQVKKQLQGAEAETYWASVKDSELPAFKGKIVSIKPETNPKELVMAVSTGDQPEVTIVMETALRGKADVGTELEFTGVAKEYTKEPFSLKLEVDNDKLKGWPVTGPAPKTPAKKGAAPAKKAATKKK